MSRREHDKDKCTLCGGTGRYLNAVCPRCGGHKFDPGDAAEMPGFNPSAFADSKLYRCIARQKGTNLGIAPGGYVSVEEGDRP